MKRSSLDITLRDKVQNHIIRQRSREQDAVERIANFEIARMTDETWTRRITEWRPRHEAYRSIERPPNQMEG